MGNHLVEQLLDRIDTLEQARHNHVSLMEGVHRQLKELRIRVNQIESRLNDHDYLFLLNTQVHAAISENATAVEKALEGITGAISTPFEDTPENREMLRHLYFGDRAK